jgi:hypothetical protein
LQGVAEHDTSFAQSAGTFPEFKRTFEPRSIAAGASRNWSSAIFAVGFD